jgi:hypothetical protein
VLQLSAIDQEVVFYALAECHHLGELQVDLVFGQAAGDGIEEAAAVGAADCEEPALGFVVGG